MADNPIFSRTVPSSAPFNEKATSTLADTKIERPSTPSSTSADHEIMEGALFSLLMGAFLPCIPIALVTAILLSFILYNRLDVNPASIVLAQAIPNASESTISNSLNQLNDIKMYGGGAAYYLASNHFTQPSTLHTVASLTGKIMPFLTSSSMALVAFFTGRRILDATKSNKQHQMLTPHQMSILISLLNGSGIKPLWDTIVYRYQNHVPLVQPVHLAFGSLSFIVIMTFAIQAVDSWLGIAMKAMNIPIVKNLDTVAYSYGRELNTTTCNHLMHSLPCPSDSSSSCMFPCSITDWMVGNSSRIGVQHAQEAAESLMDTSYSNVIRNVSAGPNKSQFYFLGDIRSSDSLDYITNTLAVTTQCSVITQNCSVGKGFNCSNGYSAPSFAYTGQVGVNISSATGLEDESSVGIQFFDDNTLSVPVGYNVSQKLFAVKNPVSFLLWSKGFPPVDTTMNQFWKMDQGGYLKNDSSGDPVFILNCSMAIYHAKYLWQNGSVQGGGFFPVALADPAYGAIYSAPFAIDSALGHLSLQDAAALAAYQPKPQTLASHFAGQFSHAAVALTAGISSPSINLNEQIRKNTVLVTRVPLAPLYTLIALKGVYALFALILAALAVMLADPIRSQEVKERLTIDGLAAGLFEADAHKKSAVRDVQKLFDEHNKSTEKTARTEANDLPRKIGMQQNENGGWSWVATARRTAETTGLGVLASMAANAAFSDVVGTGELGVAGDDLQVLKSLL